VLLGEQAGADQSCRRCARSAGLDRPLIQQFAFRLPESRPATWEIAADREPVFTT
jgi:hypothetical protein